MSKVICIAGESGSGKTTSMRNLDPKTTMYIDCDKKGLSWKGWREQYNSENQNYIKTDFAQIVQQTLQKIDKSEKWKHIKVVVVDTINGLMVADEMRRSKEKGYDKWVDLAACVWDLVNETYEYRDDLTIIFTAHTQTEHTRFKQTFESINERGSIDVWLKHMKELRKNGRIETKFLLAASFSSVLVHLLGGLPFFVDLWGETEGGKTVSLMVAASVWADPDESRYIGDFKTTDVALEAKADMLNHLPMFLDDTSKTSSRIRDNFEGIVYDLCSGKGKSRSNKDLGINRENRWKNVIICNGERPLSSYVNQGGAINRILEVECGEKVYENPQRTAETVKKNYGTAGKRFVEIVKGLGTERIREIQNEFQKKLFNMDKMQKQSISLSIVLTADKIATDYIFKDEQYISIDDARKVLIDRNDVSDNERCYHFIQDKVAMNGQRFDAITSCEKWGIIENGYAIFYSSAFDQICKDGGFSKKSFLSWADKKALIQTQAGRQTKVKKINGTSARCVWIKLDEDIDADGFKPVDDEQEELPFK